MRRASLLVHLLFTTLLVVCAGYYTLVQLTHSGHSPFWLDEVYGLSFSVRKANFLDLLLNGAQGQASPSPLDYLLIKLLDNFKQTFAYLGLHPHTYFRLISLTASILAGLLVAMFVQLRRQDSIEGQMFRWLFALMAVLLFWFSPWTYRYAVEMRPYSLWNSLWFVALGLFFVEPLPRKALVAVLVLLSLSSVASCYQLMCLAVCFFTVGLCRAQQWRNALGETLRMFSLPTLLCAYYVIKIGKWSYPGEQLGTFEGFLEFYLDNYEVFFLCTAASAFLMLRKGTRWPVVPAAAMVLLYLIAPLIYLLTRENGFFFSERQYIFFSTATPLFMLAVGMSFPGHWPPLKRLALHGAGLVLLVAVFLGSLLEPLEQSRDLLALPGKWNVPADPKGLLWGRLTQELPAGFCTQESFDVVSLANLRLVGEWLPIYYPDVPPGSAVVAVRKNGDGNVEVVSVGRDDCPQEMFVPLSRRSTRYGTPQ